MANNKLNFNGRVAIVTGAGGGLGREYALLLASRGCSVVVNDLEPKAADAVVSEINSKGGAGKAVANYNSVEDGEAIVQTALKAFQRIDILINNAGILRDKSLLKMTDADWDIIQRVHLRGSFLVSRAAWPHMRERGYGRIIMTASSAGLYGNFGQSNYAAAKMGLIGLSNTLAVEGAKYNIHSNVIIPIAASRLTADIIPEQMLKRLLPSYVAPVVAYLCHESCKETGGTFEASGGWVARYKLHRSRGKVFNEELTLEALERDWAQITSMEGGAHLGSITEHFSALIESLGSAENAPVVAEMQAKGADENNNNNSSSSNKNDDEAILKSIPVSGNKCDILFTVIERRMKEEMDLVEQLKAVFQYNITQNGKHITTWTADTKNEVAVYNSEPKNNVKPDCVVTVDDDDFVKIMVGKLNPQRAFIMGKLNIKGNILLLQRLNTLWTQFQMDGKAPELPLLASAVLNYKLIPGVKCDAMLVEMFIRIARAPQIIKDFKGVFRLHVTKNNQEVTCYTINLTEEKPTFYRGAGQSDKTDFELTLDDDDFVRLMYNRIKLRDSVESGRIKVSGNTDLAYKLQPLFSHLLQAKL